MDEWHKISMFQYFNISITVLHGAWVRVKVRYMEGKLLCARNILVDLPFPASPSPGFYGWWFARIYDIHGTHGIHGMQSIQVQYSEWVITARMLTDWIKSTNSLRTCSHRSCLEIQSNYSISSAIVDVTKPVQVQYSTVAIAVPYNSLSLTCLEGLRGTVPCVPLVRRRTASILSSRPFSDHSQTISPTSNIHFPLGWIYSVSRTEYSQPLSPIVAYHQKTRWHVSWLYQTSLVSAMGGETRATLFEYRRLRVIDGAIFDIVRMYKSLALPTDHSPFLNNCSLFSENPRVRIFPHHFNSPTLQSWVRIVSTSLSLVF